jgi:hypothetical protein
MLEARVLELNGDEMNLGLYGTRLCFAREMDCLNYKGISTSSSRPLRYASGQVNRTKGKRANSNMRLDKLYYMGDFKLPSF